jgi:2-polyprenyl-3-methyl-5-hydroxy-6-metoxy-1,4-benzoquinol methylase
VGTGFYSKQFLNIGSILGTGYDTSPFSLNHTQHMIQRLDLSEQYCAEERDIVARSRSEQADAIVNVEVLEHLEEPEVFLASLLEILRPGGIGFITAAINAPNANHIYLYRKLRE